MTCLERRSLLEATCRQSRNWPAHSWNKFNPVGCGKPRAYRIIRVMIGTCGIGGHEVSRLMRFALLTASYEALWVLWVFLSPCGRGCPQGRRGGASGASVLLPLRLFAKSKAEPSPGASRHPLPKWEREDQRHRSRNARLHGIVLRGVRDRQKANRCWRIDLPSSGLRPPSPTRGEGRPIRQTFRRFTRLDNSSALSLRSL